ncbi:hypothetical protein H2203_001547 [Taxawa tesnikishii (nom. ined.)]|nr:hypothetical protein H2203_001547 [Dothideales sp. JES 119]
MAAAIKALNARIRSNPYTDYLCSTHFWGPASNFGIPIAAVMDTQKDPEMYAPIPASLRTASTLDSIWRISISGPMTLALCGYSATFMRYAMAVTPKNYLLFGCHFVNFGAQSTQAYRYLSYWNFGGREKTLAEKATHEANNVKNEARSMADTVKSEAQAMADKTKQVTK